MNPVTHTRKIKAQDVYLLPIILIIGYIPLLVHITEYDAGLDTVVWGMDGFATDYFFACKMYALLAVSVIMMILLAHGIRHGSVNIRKLPHEFLLLPAYGALILISSLASPWRSYAFTGTIDMFQTCPIIFSYILMCLYSYCFIKTKEDIFFIAGASFPGILIMGLIGASQALGHNFLHTDFAIRLMLLGKFDEYSGQISIDETVFGTLSNPDYFGMYTVMLIPVLIAFLITAPTIRYRILTAFTLFLFLIAFIGGRVASAWISLAAVFLTGLLILTFQNKKLFIPASILLALIISAIIAFVLSQTLRDNIPCTHFDTDEADPKIETLDDRIRFTYPDGNTISIRYISPDTEASTILVSDASDRALSLMPNESYDLEDEMDPDEIARICLADESYDLTGFSFVSDEDPSPCLRLFWNEKYYDFIKEDDGGYFYITPYLRNHVKIEEPEKYDIFPDSFMSGRGRIWDYSMTMLREHMLLGTGSNLFVFSFPHSYSHYADSVEFDVKPHSLYLQQWIEHGFPAFCLFLIFYIIYLVRSIRSLCLSGRHDFLNIISLSLFLSIAGYMISGFVNDGMIFISPFYWIFLGTSMRIIMPHGTTAE